MTLILIYTTFSYYLFLGLYNGTFVRIELMNTRGYLGCPSDVCDLRKCSSSNFKNFDTCSGESFQILGERGGNIESGQRVRFRYVSEVNSWLGCPHRNRCDKRTCPGAIGSRAANNFNTCWGERFVIYGRGRNHGEKILNGDIVSIYFLPQESGVTYSKPGYITIKGSTVGADTSLDSCLGSVPPAYFRYPHCPTSVFRIHKKTIEL